MTQQTVGVFLPADIVGLVADFACASPKQALLNVGRVNRTWQQGVTNNDAMWLRFARVRWPQTKASSGRLSVYRGRVLAVKQLAPLPSDRLHPIEDCSLEFTCPYFEENLFKPVTDAAVIAANNGNPVFDCSVCQKHVYVVRTQADMDARTLESRCVMFNPSDCKDPSSLEASGVAEVAVCASTEDVARMAVRQIKAKLMASEESVTPEGDGFLWDRRSTSAMSVRIHAYWNADHEYRGNASLLLVVRASGDGWVVCCDDAGRLKQPRMGEINPTDPNTAVAFIRRTFAAPPTRAVRGKRVGPPPVAPMKKADRK